jgi:hypothetical protein
MEPDQASSGLIDSEWSGTGLTSIGNAVEPERAQFGMIWNQSEVDLEWSGIGASSIWHRLGNDVDCSGNLYVWTNAKAPILVVLQRFVYHQLLSCGRSIYPNANRLFHPIQMLDGSARRLIRRSTLMTDRSIPVDRSIQNVNKIGRLIWTYKDESIDQSIQIESDRPVHPNINGWIDDQHSIDRSIESIQASIDRIECIGKSIQASEGWIQEESL